MPPPEHAVFIALGSNLGDSRAVLSAAMAELERFSRIPILRSSLWRTSPVDCPPGSPAFLNAVIALAPQPSETPESLLEKLQELEARFGRLRKQVVNEPRPLDLDLLAFGSEIRASPKLQLPHPRGHERLFVVAPLAEIAPELTLPGQIKTAAQILRELSIGSPEVIEKLG